MPIGVIEQVKSDMLVYGISHYPTTTRIFAYRLRLDPTNSFHGGIDTMPAAGHAQTRVLNPR
jgi:hypothetical protein